MPERVPGSNWQYYASLWAVPKPQPPRKRQSHFGLVPEKERPIAAGWAGVGFSIGAMLAPPIIVLAHVALGWQGAFLFSGALAMIWVLLWWRFYHSPDTHPNLSQEEFELIHQDNEPVLPRLPFLKSLAILSKIRNFTVLLFPRFWRNRPGLYLVSGYRCI